MGNRIMAHLVASYPSYDESLLAGTALSDGGAEYLELQFPFSDPMADGPLIQEACTRAIEAGFTIAEGFRLAAELKKKSGRKVFIMSYGTLVFNRGIKQFVKEAKACGAEGLIVPDLVYKADEGLYEACFKEGLECVPVIAPNISSERLNELIKLPGSFIYAALRTGITGSRTDIAASKVFLEKAGKEKKILAGFGINSREQVEAVKDMVHACVAGSFFTAIIKESVEKNPLQLYNRIKQAALLLSG